jgi:putative inorganic carbon (hco3(-)) transporter
LVPPPILKKLSLWLATAAAVTILLSIAVSQILLGLAIGVLLLSGLPLRWPRIAIPLGLFLLWTLLSLAFSPDPANGLTQVRKMPVFLTMLTVYSSVLTLAEIRILVLSWVGVGTITAGLGIFQFAHKWAQAIAQHRDFYDFYIDQRITGFQNHWMTFSGQELFLLLMLAAFLLFGPNVRRNAWIWVPCAVAVGTVLILSYTRGVLAAAVIAVTYLLWAWKRVAVLAMPVLLLIVFLAGPASLRQRVTSIWSPEQNTDSNEHRFIVWRTGWEMIKAHPVFGVGPEEIGKDKIFYAYLPRDIPLPLPPGFYKHLHSIYIHYAAERGIPAALFLTGALLMALYDFQRALKTLPPGRSDRRFLLHWASASVIGTMIVGIGDLNLGLSDELTMFLVVMCLGYTAARCYNEPFASVTQSKQSGV